MWRVPMNLSWCSGRTRMILAAHCGSATWEAQKCSGGKCPLGAKRNPCLSQVHEIDECSARTLRLFCPLRAVRAGPAKTGNKTVDGPSSTKICAPQCNHGVPCNGVRTPKCAARSGRPSEYCQRLAFTLYHDSVYGLLGVTREPFGADFETGELISDLSG